MHQGLAWNLSTKRKREKRGERKKRTSFPPLCSRRHHCKKPLADLIDYMTKGSVKIRATVWHGIYLQREKERNEGKGKKTRFPPLCSRRPHCKKPLVDLIDYMTKRSVKIRARVWHGIYQQREKERNEGKGKKTRFPPLPSRRSRCGKITGRSYRLHDEEVG